MNPTAKGLTVSTDRERAIFNRLSEKYKQTGQIVTPGFVRIEKKIQNGNPKYDFQILRDTNSDFVTEQKLDRNDKFLATHLGILLMNRIFLIAGEGGDTESPIGQEVLQTYPNAEVFESRAADLEALYNGKLSIMVGQTKYVEALDTRRFRYVPTSQQIIAGNGATPTELNIAIIRQSEQHENSGFISLTPQIEFDGDQKNQITLEAPIDARHVIQNTGRGTLKGESYLVLMMRGFLVTNR